MREGAVNKCLQIVERCYFPHVWKQRIGEEVAGTGQATTIVPGSYRPDRRKTA
jgi:hypothetical protein